MPYLSTKQRGFIHAKAAEGVPWAQKFVKDADKAEQPTNQYVKAKVKKRRHRRHRKGKS